VEWEQERTDLDAAMKEVASYDRRLGRHHRCRRCLRLRRRCRVAYHLLDVSAVSAGPRCVPLSSLHTWRCSYVCRVSRRRLRCPRPCLRSLVSPAPLSGRCRSRCPRCRLRHCRPAHAPRCRSRRRRPRCHTHPEDSCRLRRRHPRCHTRHPSSSHPRLRRRHRLCCRCPRCRPRCSRCFRRCFRRCLCHLRR
jgi:hypothetical protein